MRGANMHETQTRLVRWSSQRSFVLGEAFDLCRAIFSTDRAEDSKPGFVLAQLALSCHLTSESALLLVSNVRVWDADILVRSVVEGTLKFAYLGSGTDDARAEKTKEYWDVLPDISRLKRHQRVDRFLAVVDNPEADEWRPLRDLRRDQGEFEELQGAYPKKLRQPIEQRWSFAEIGQALSRDDPGSGFDLLKHFLFNYGMASHLAHQDADAVGMVWERFQREPDRYEAVQVAHGARTISDLLVMAMVRTLVLHKVFQRERKPVRELFDQHNGLLEEMHAAQAEWHEIEYGAGAE